MVQQVVALQLDDRDCTQRYTVRDAGASEKYEAVEN